MVVLLSPAFLKRECCRREVLAFTARMTSEGQTGRLFPVRWIATPRKPDDELLKRLEAHHAVDWTGLRHESWSSTPKLRALSELAGAVGLALAETA